MKKTNLYTSSSNFSKFVFQLLMLGIPSLILIVVTNYFGDSAKLFNDDYEKIMAAIIAEGKYVTNVVDYDERLFQKEVIAKLECLPDVVVIGSSRTMLINENYFKNCYVQNSSVSGASIEDLIAIFQIYKLNDLIPETVIIGIDPWTFNEYNGQKRWRSLSKEYFSFIGKVNDKDRINFYKYYQLMSPSYFQSSIQSIISSNGNPVSTLKRYNRTKTILTDGSIVYGNSMRKASREKIDFKVSNYISTSIYGIGDFSVLSHRFMADFYFLVSYLLKNNIKLEFFLAPYHPRVYNVIINEYPLVNKTEQFLREFATKESIKIYGSFNPYKYEMDASFFYDGMHCKEIGIEKIIQMTKDN